MASHRFEIGECVTYIEKRFPNGVRRTELVVIDLLVGAGEPQYQLSGADGLARCVLAESQLSPARPAQAARAAERLDAPAPADPDREESPWSA